MTLVVYVSGHGFGHASRVAEVVRALRGQTAVHVRSEAPHWFFTRANPEVECSAAPIDVGILQPNGLELDLAGSLLAHERFIDGWESALRREVEFLHAVRATMLLADIPALAFPAARSLGLPAFGMANFGWDWILEAHVPAEPRWGPIVARYRDAYALADGLYRLPFHGEFPAFLEIVDVPLVVQSATLERGRTLRMLGIDDSDARPLVLVSFGGIGTGPLAFDRPDALDDFRFVAFGPAPAGWRGEWTALRAPLEIAHADLMAACDAIIGKPGYGLVGEAIVGRTRFLYLSRQDFRETPLLVAGLEELGCAREISRQDFFGGRWRGALEGLFAQPADYQPIRSDGARVVAEQILARGKPSRE